MKIPRLQILNHGQIGWLRARLMIRGASKWNATVRDVTAYLG